MRVPVADLALGFVPAFAAILLGAAEGELSGVRALLRRSLVHLPSMQAVGAPGPDVAWWVQGAVGVRVLMVWLYENTGGSTAAVIVFHALLNAGRVATYPAVGAHYDPRYRAAGHAVAAGMAVVVTLVWGWRTLACPTWRHDR